MTKRPRDEGDRHYDENKHLCNLDEAAGVDNRCARCKLRGLPCHIVADDSHDSRWSCLPCFFDKQANCEHGFQEGKPLRRPHRKDGTSSPVSVKKLPRSNKARAVPSGDGMKRAARTSAKDARSKIKRQQTAHRDLGEEDEEEAEESGDGSSASVSEASDSKGKVGRQALIPRKAPFSVVVPTRTKPLEVDEEKVKMPELAMDQYLRRDHPAIQAVEERRLNIVGCLRLLAKTYEDVEIQDSRVEGILSDRLAELQAGALNQNWMSHSVANLRAFEGKRSFDAHVAGGGEVLDDAPVVEMEVDKEGDEEEAKDGGEEERENGDEEEREEEAKDGDEEKEDGKEGESDAAAAVEGEDGAGSAS
ncbi:hypothetical protein RQP46_002043 [Phenoliferia psychrophenolica]